MKAPNSGGYLLQNWLTKCNDKNHHSPTGDSGATSMPPIGDSFMYIETCLIVMEKMYLFFSNEQTSFKLVT